MCTAIDQDVPFKYPSLPYNPSCCGSQVFTVVSREPSFHAASLWITPNPRDVPSPVHQRPNRRLIQEALPSTFSAIPLYTTMPGECLGTTNIPPPPATAYSLTRGSKSVSPMVSHKHIKWPLSSRILTPTVGYHHHHHHHLSTPLRSSTFNSKKQLTSLKTLAILARFDKHFTLPTARLPLSYLNI